MVSQIQKNTNRVVVKMGFRGYSQILIFRFFTKYADFWDFGIWVAKKNAAGLSFENVFFKKVAKIRKIWVFFFLPPLI